MSQQKVIVTGAAGFIGMHLCERLLADGYEVVGIDSLKPSYGGPWAEIRRDRLLKLKRFTFHEWDLSDPRQEQALEALIDGSIVIHLAAWPGVKSGQENPSECASANIVAFSRVLSAVTRAGATRFMFASSSSIYGDLGATSAVAEREAKGENLKSFYAHTKWMNEEMARSESERNSIPTVALRFFSVIGEFGRPDMACWQFYKKVAKGEAITLHGANGGSRNFTYVRDAVAMVSRLISIPTAGFEAVNIACGPTIETIEMLGEIEKVLNKKSIRNVVPTPAYDIVKSWADTSKLQNFIGSTEPTPISAVVKRFSEWYESVKPADA